VQFGISAGILSEKYSAPGFRIGVDYVIYAMTH